MPEGYEKLRDRFLKEGLSAKAAKKKAAKIWNSIAGKKGLPTVGRGRG